MQSTRLAIGATRQTEMVEGLEDTHALQMVQARGVRCQRMLGILQYATPRTTYPELAGFLVLRVRGTLYVHELHLNLERSGSGVRDYSAGGKTPTHLQLESIQRQHLRRGARKGAKR